MKLYIQLGRTGDVINLLPLAYADAQSGQRSAIMTCHEFSTVLEGCSYIDVVKFDGQIHELERAVLEAKAISNEIIVTQVLGPTKTLKNVGQESRHTDSFIKEAWYLAGRLKDWQQQAPLVFDRRSPERELALLQSINPQKTISRQRKYVLIASSGETSPFPYKPLLFELISGRFKSAKTFNATLIDLDDLKAERFYDLVGLYEKAYCLIACDSAPLHLAHACPTLPVCALVNDTPSYWHGSAWRRNHIFHCRYKDFPNRAVEMLDAIENVMMPGSPFVTGVKGQKLIHAYNAYELNGEHEAAMETWRREYRTGRWIATPIERGACGRDTKTALRDAKRFPFLKDAIRLASMRAKDNDVIVLTRDHTCFEEGMTERLTRELPCYAHRRFREPETFHPAYDLFAFTKRWWSEHRGEVPDLVMGKDHYWHRILAEVIKQNGGKELTDSIYRNQKDD